MQFRRMMATIVVAIIASFTLIACSNSPTKSATPVNQENQKAQAYLLSNNRAKQFNDLVPLAGSKLAQALDAGTFGVVHRLRDDNYHPMPANFSGLGVIATLDMGIQVTLHWTDGKINFDQPIASVSIRTASQPATEATFYAPQESVSNDRDYYWVVVKSTGVNNSISSEAYNIGYPADSTNRSFPASFDELKSLDSDSLSLLRTYLATNLGPDWMN